jgi:hypothetical protein
MVYPLPRATGAHIIVKRNLLERDSNSGVPGAGLESIVPKPITQHEIEIVMAIDRSTRVLDLRVFAIPHNKRRTKIVGSVNLRMEDLRGVVPMLAERLRFEDLLIEAEANARNSKNPKVANS